MRQHLGGVIQDSSALTDEPDRFGGSQIEQPLERVLTEDCFVFLLSDIHKYLSIPELTIKNERALFCFGPDCSGAVFHEHTSAILQTR